MASTRRARHGYLSAVVIVLAAALLRLAIGQLGASHIPFVTFYPAVMAAGIYGGMLPGLLATVLSAWLSTFWMEPAGIPWASNPADWVTLAVFLSTGILISYSAELMYRALERAKEAEARVKLAAEREEAAAAIRESEERFRTLADNMSQFAWMADEKGWIFWYNKRWYDYTGTILEGMQGWGWKKLIDPDHVDRVVGRIQRSWDTGEPWEDTFPLRGKDGRYRWFLSRALPIRDENGRIVRWFGTNTDITDQLRTESELRESREKYRRLVNLVPAAIFTCDAEGAITFFNKRAVELWGREPISTIDRYCGSWHMYRPSGSPLPHEKCPTWVTVRQGIPFRNEEIVIERPDGSRVTASANIDPIMDDSGQRTGAINILVDITERKRIEEKLRRSEEQLRLATMGTGVWSWRSGDNYPEVSEDWRTLFGIGAEEVVTLETWRELIHPDDRERAFKAFFDAYERRGQYEAEYRIVRPDGTVRWVVNRGRVWHDENGVPVGMAGLNIDITGLKQIEEALRNSEEKLRLALDAAQMGTWEWNIVTGEIAWSDRCREFFAIGPDEKLSYERFMSAVHPEDRDRVHALVLKAIQEKTVYEAEMRAILPDGSVRWSLAKGRTSYDSSGNAVHMSGIGMDITERKRMEADLLRSKQEWERTFDSVPDMIAIMDPHYRILRANRAMTERLGLSSEEIVGRPCHQLVHGTALPPDFCPHTKALAKGREHVVEIYEKRIGGYFLLSVTPLLDEEGKILGTVHVARDITERKRMEEALEKRIVALTRPLDSTEEIAFEDLFNMREIQELQDRFAKACGVASIITRTDGTPITTPSNFCRLCRDIIRTTEKGSENCHCSDAVVGRQNAGGPNIQPCLSGGLWDAGASISVGGRHIANWLVGQVRNETQNEAKMRRYAREIGADEDELVSAFREVPSMPLEQFENVARALFTLAGELSSMAYQNVQQARFITERGLLEEELRTARDELEIRIRERTAELERANETLRDQASLLDLAHDAILVRNMQSAIVFWNRGATETYGFTREEALGRFPHELLRTKFPESLENIIRQVMEHQRWEGELRHTTATGKEIVVESLWALKADAQGKPSGLLEINRDITERKRAEEALRANMERLELINAELQEFAFVASHDLQEPLRKIQTFGSMLQTRCETALDDSGQVYLDRVLKSATRMRLLLDDLLQYSRVAARPEPFKRVNLMKTVREAADVFEEQIKQEGAKLEIGDLPVIAADEGQMIRLFQNLIGNALKFRSAAQPVIQIYAHCSSHGRGYCDICVKDNGIGFEQRYADLIFKPFQRLHGRIYEGTGMGLAICRKIAERHGGTIRADSEPGAGAAFTIRLPLEQGFDEGTQ